MTKYGRDNKSRRWMLFIAMLWIMLLGVGIEHIFDFATFDVVMLIYVYGIIICTFGFSLFVWLRSSGQRMSQLQTCLMLLFAAGIWSFALDLVARYFRVVRTLTDVTPLFTDSIVWKFRVFPKIFLYAWVVIFVWVRLKYGKDESEK